MKGKHLNDKIENIPGPGQVLINLFSMSFITDSKEIGMGTVSVKEIELTPTPVNITQDLVHIILDLSFTKAQNFLCMAVAFRNQNRPHQVLEHITRTRMY